MLAWMGGKFLVVAVDFDWCRDSMHMVAYSPLFEEVPEGCAALDYHFLVDYRDGDSQSPKFVVKRKTPTNQPGPGHSDAL